MNIQLKKGVMEIVVLSMLRRRDFYGYELVSEISKYIEMSEGTIYPLLNRFNLTCKKSPPSIGGEMNCGFFCGFDALRKTIAL